MSRKGNNKGQPQSEAPKQDKRASLQQNNPSGERGNGGNGNAAANGGRDQVFDSEEIAERAYQIFEREGRTDGRDMDHWLQAERELRMERERRGGEMNAQNTLNAQNAPRSARQHQQQP
jgi:hypothetical protein